LFSVFVPQVDQIVLSDEEVINVVYALTRELCYLGAGAWEKKEMLCINGDIWDDIEKKEKEFKQKETCKKQGRRDDGKVRNYQRRLTVPTGVVDSIIMAGRLIASLVAGFIGIRNNQESGM
jgi:hypothetical protein